MPPLQANRMSKLPKLTHPTCTEQIKVRTRTIISKLYVSFQLLEAMFPDPVHQAFSGTGLDITWGLPVSRPPFCLAPPHPVLDATVSCHVTRRHSLTAFQLSKIIETIRFVQSTNASYSIRHTHQTATEPHTPVDMSRVIRVVQ